MQQGQCILPLSLTQWGAEGEGFEPPVTSSATTLFKSAAINHSAIPPSGHCLTFSVAQGQRAVNVRRLNLDNHQRFTISSPKNIGVQLCRPHGNGRIFLADRLQQIALLMRLKLHIAHRPITAAVKLLSKAQ